jgi:general secretion pathway protein J
MEVLVAMSVLALVGLMAWRGMDAMIRAKEVISQRTELDTQYLHLAKQFDKDCNEMPSAHQIGFSPIIMKDGELWLLRRITINGHLNWMLVFYKADKTGFIRQEILSTVDLLEIKRYLTSMTIGQSLSQVNQNSTLKINAISHQELELIPPSNQASTDFSRGIKVRWYANNLPNPLVRSCLIGQGL